MPKMNPDRLRDHKAMVAKVQAALDALDGRDIQIEALRERLGIGPDDAYQRQVLKYALDEIKGRDTAKRGRAVGWWRSSVPVQQPLPVPRVNDLTGLKPQTVEVLRERLVHARQEHPNEGYSIAEWQAALLSELTEVAVAAVDDIAERPRMVRDELLDVAVVALRAYEEWGR
jgi:hypothetical protein